LPSYREHVVEEGDLVIDLFADLDVRIVAEVDVFPAQAESFTDPNPVWPRNSKRGMTYRAIAIATGLSRARVAQIVTERGAR
jgi:hypothetical protein